MKLLDWTNDLFTGTTRAPEVQFKAPAMYTFVGALRGPAPSAPPYTLTSPPTATIASVPLLIVVEPLKVFEAVRVTTPGPSLTTKPPPLMIPGTVRFPSRLNTGEVLSVMLPVPIEPLVPPAPTVTDP